MKKMITVALSFIFMVGISGLAIAGSLDSPGAPSAGSGMYTLQNLYDYLTSGAALTVQSSFQEPTSGPGSTMKTTKQIGDDVKAVFDLCATTTAANVESGKPFFCTQPGSWGIQTGTAQLVPTPTPTLTPTATITPYGVYASCKAILTATPGAGSGTYTIDPDGAGGAAPFSAYCDNTIDGGGWTLVVRIVNDRNHVGSASYGTLTAPDQATSAKLSDATINILGTELYRVTCGNIDYRYFDSKQKTFSAVAGAPASAVISKSSATYEGAYCVASPISEGVIGLSSYPGCEEEYIYSYNGSQTGCDDQQWGRSGVVFAR
ncbi:MAG: fibrinogen-like YCDxxxxGGGW domain-containing protein [Candidatus Aureabacteria bacterium]|nr:fibrinogen-like YCDxxxxGGGW domain-containing protein [Candidatus Auribacterota bacterium]